MTFDAGSVEARLTLSRDEFNKALDQAKADADRFAGKDIRAKVTADGAEAKKTLDDLQARKDKLGKAASIKVQADASQANAEMDKTSAKADALGKKDPTVKVKADTAAADAALDRTALKADAVGRKTPTVKVSADTATAGRNVDTLSSKLTNLSKQMQDKSGPAWLGPLLLGLPAISTLGGVAAGAIGALGGAFLATGLATAGFGAVAKPVLTDAKTAADAVAKAQSNYSAAIASGVNPAKAYKAEQLAISKAYADMSPQQVTLSKQIGDMATAWGKVKTAEAPLVAGALQPWLRTITSLTGDLAPIIKAVAPVIHDLGVKISDVVNAPEFKTFINFIAGTGSAGLNAVGSTMIDLIKSFIILLPKFKPLIDEANAGIANFGAKVLAWAQSQKAADDITKFIDWFNKNGPGVWTLIKNLGDALKALSPGLTAGGATEIHILSDFFGWIAKLPPSFAKPITEVAGALLLASKLGVLSLGVKIVGVGSKMLEMFTGGAKATVDATAMQAAGTTMSEAAAAMNAAADNMLRAAGLSDIPGRGGAGGAAKTAAKDAAKVAEGGGAVSAGEKGAASIGEKLATTVKGAAGPAVIAAVVSQVAGGLWNKFMPKVAPVVSAKPTGTSINIPGQGTVKTTTGGSAFTKTENAWARTGAMTGTGAAAGAIAGSILPGPGTAIGAGIGAGVGFVGGVLKDPSSALKGVQDLVKVIGRDIVKAFDFSPIIRDIKSVGGWFKGIYDSAIHPVSVAIGAIKDGFHSLIGPVKDAFKAITDALGFGGKANEASSAIQKIGTIFHDVQNIAKVAWGAIKIYIDVVGVVIKGIITFAEKLLLNFVKFGVFKETFHILGDAIRIVGVVIGTIIDLLTGKWSAAWGNIQKIGGLLINMVGTAFKEIWNIIQAFAATVWQAIGPHFMSAVVTPLHKAWSSIINFFTGNATFAPVWAAIVAAAKIGWAAITGLFRIGAAVVTVVFKNAWDVMAAVVKVAWAAIQVVIKTAWAVIAGIFRTGVAVVTVVFKNAWDVLAAVAKVAWAAIQAVIKIAWDIIVGIINAGLALVTGHWKQAWTDVTNTATQVWNALKQFFGTTLNAISGLFTQILNNIKGFLSTTWNAISSTAQSVWNSIKSFLSTILNAILALVTQVFNNIKSFLQATWNAISSTAQSVWNTIKASLSATWTSMSSTAQSVWNGIKSFFSTVLSGIQTGFSNAVAGIKSVWSGLQDAVKAPVSFIVNTIYDKGIVPVVNAVGSLIGLHLNQLPVPFAEGGMVPGGYSRADNQLAWVRSGEGVLQPGAVTALGGPAFIDAANRAYGDVPVGSSATGHYAAGGTTPNVGQGIHLGTTAQPTSAPGGVLGTIGHAAGDVGGAIVHAVGDIGKKLANLTGDALGAAAKLILDPLLNQMPGGGTPIGAGLKKIPEKMIDGLISKLKGTTPPGGGAGGALGHAVPNVGSGVMRWDSLVKQALSMLHLSASLASQVEYQMMTESGGNPNITNTTDCVTLDYVILTKRGWLYHDQIQAGDETLGYNPGTQRSEWTAITRVVYYEDAEVWRIGNNHWHADVTPNHRWWSDTRFDRKPETLTACPECGWTGRTDHSGRNVTPTPRSISTHRGRIHGVKTTRTVGYKGEFVTTDALKSDHRLRLTAPADTDGIPGLSLDECRIIAWLQGDGTIRPALAKPAICPECGWIPGTGRKPGRGPITQPGNSVAVHRAKKHGVSKDRAVGELAGYDGTIWQSKPAQIIKLRALLARVEHTETVRQRPGNTMPAYSFNLRRAFVTDLLKRSRVMETGPEAFVLALSPDQRAAWLDSMIDAEGHRQPVTTTDGTRRGASGEFVRIAQINGPLQEAIKLAVYLEGYRPTFAPLTRHSDRHQPAGNVGMARPHIAPSMFNPPEVLERQPVWCVTTELGTWTTRGGDALPFLTGNSNAAAGTPSTGLLTFAGHWPHVRRVSRGGDEQQH